MKDKIINDVIDELLIEYKNKQDNYKKNIVNLYLKKDHTKFFYISKYKYIMLVNLDIKQQNFLIIPNIEETPKSNLEFWIISLKRDRKYIVWNDIQKKTFKMFPEDIDRQIRAF